MFVLSNEQMKFNTYNSILWFFIWSGPQENYSTVKKEILTIVLCIQNFQEDIFNKKIPFASRLQMCKRNSSKACLKYCFKTKFC